MTRRRQSLLLGLFAFAAVAAAPGTAPAEIAAPARGRPPAAAANPPAPRSASASPRRPTAAAARQASPARPSAATPRSGPEIDLPPVRPTAAATGAAPVPDRRMAPPRGDLEPRPGLSFGVPTPREFARGDTFDGRDDQSARAQSERPQEALRTPSLGATVRLPF